MTSRDLIEVPVGEWEGMIFVRAKAGGAAIDVEAWLGDYARHLRAFDLANASYIDTGRLDVNGGAKVGHGAE